MTDLQKIDELARLVLAGGNVVFFGGAGVSTESGIPDFRSESGLFSAMQVYGRSPEELLSYSFFRREPELFFRYYKENLVSLDAKPNAAHTALAELERGGKLKAVITQNVDGLHQAAGSVNVLELHGSNHRQYCMGCGVRYTLEYILRQEGVPRCRECGGIVRPDVVLYEEGLDQDVMQAAMLAIMGAELLIVGGTSLAVYPAAGLLHCFRGGALVLINKSATPADRHAQLVINDSIGIVFAKLMESINIFK